MLWIVLTVIVATAVGVAVERRDDALAHALRRVLLQTMLWALLPFIVYVNVARAHLSLDALAAIAIAIAAISLSGAISWRLGRGAFGLPDASVGGAVVATIQANTTYFGLPLVAALFSRTELAQAVAYDAFVTLPLFVLGGFGVGARLGHSAGQSAARQLRTALRNPMLLAAVVALLVPDAWAPEPLVAPAHLLVLAQLPLGFFVVGVTLGDEAKDRMLRIPPPLTPPIAAVALLRMGFAPLVLLLVGLLLIDVPAPFYVLAAMPVAVNTVLVGHATGLDLRLMSACIAWTTIVALVGVVVLALVRAVA